MDGRKYYGRKGIRKEKRWLEVGKEVLGLKRAKRFASPLPTGLGWGPRIIYACPIHLTI